ncbi:MAG: hypothetical protein AB7U07_09345, partial [Thermoleophilia bacterium]
MVQTFLLRTSIADILDGHLAELLSGQPDGRERLAQLASSGALVTAIDRRGRWYRYHGLFAELLQARLRWQDPDLARRLHARAASWYARAGDPGRAVSHAVAAEDWRLAAEIASGQWLALLLRGELDTLGPLLAAIPSEEVAVDPSLAVAAAAIGLQTEGPERASGRVELARSAVAGAAHRPADAAGLALVELVQARHTGRPDEALAAATAVLDDTDVDAPEVDAALRSLVLTYLGTAESWTGRVLDARDHLRRAMIAAREAGSAWLELHALAYLAGAEMSCGDVPAADRRAHQGLAIAREAGWLRTPPAGAAACIAALVATLQCRLEDAASLVQVADGVVWRPSDRPIRAAVALPRLVLLCADGREGDALDVVREAIAAYDGFPLQEGVWVALRAWEARLLAATGDRPGALRVLDELQQPTAHLVISTRARFLVDEGRHAEARAVLAPALDPAGPVVASNRMDAGLVHALALDGMGPQEDAAASLERAQDVGAPGDL